MKGHKINQKFTQKPKSKVNRPQKLGVDVFSQEVQLVIRH